MALPPPRLKARKRFGQNFLVDDSVIAAIVDAINPRPGEHLIEIGPGHAALTRPVLERAGTLTAIELDRDLCEMLRHDPFLKGLTLIEGDALKVDFEKLDGAGDLRIFGNLPYNITSPVIFHLLTQKGIRDMHFMLQKEVVERLCAAPGSRDYGRLTVMVQYCAKPYPMLTVSNTAFMPRPKVTSAVVRLIPRDLNDEQRALRPFLNRVTTCAFSGRRKTLRNAVSALFSQEELAALSIDSSLRPEDLSVDEYVKLADALSKKSPSLQETQE